jgi:hypothetical protein
VRRLLRDSASDFAAACDLTARALGVDTSAVVKDYWVTEVLRILFSARVDPGGLVFKGGTSLSKAHRVIERFSEDVDIVVPPDTSHNGTKRRLRLLASTVSSTLGIPHQREAEGRGFLNARFAVAGMPPARALSPGVLLEIGTRSGRTPNARMSVTSLVADAISKPRTSAADIWADMAPVEVTVLSPERTVAEKLAHLHHRATIGDVAGLRQGARHLYDIGLALRAPAVRDALRRTSMAELMIDIDARSIGAGWRFTPRPVEGFAVSRALSDDPDVSEAYRRGFADLADLVWGDLPSPELLRAEIRAHHDLI